MTKGRGYEIRKLRNYENFVVRTFVIFVFRILIFINNSLNHPPQSFSTILLSLVHHFCDKLELSY